MWIYWVIEVVLLISAFVAGVLVGRKHPADVEKVVGIVKR
jgi:hypothetical protein